MTQRLHGPSPFAFCLLPSAFCLLSHPVAAAGHAEADADADTGSGAGADAAPEGEQERERERVPPSTAPGGRSTAARAEPAEVKLGGTVAYTITVRRAAGDRVQLWPAGADPFGGFRPLALTGPTVTPEGLVVAETYQVRLVALEPGDAGIPPVRVSVVSEDGRVFEMAAAAVPVTVLDPLADEPLGGIEARGDKGADGKTNPLRPYVVWVRDWTAAIVAGAIAGALLVALAAVLLTRWYVRRRAAPAATASPEPPAHPAARARLGRLRVPGTYAAMGAKAFHVEMVEAVKEYLGRRHRIDALEMTSEEILDVVERVPMGSITRTEMEMFLASCDVVKFAKGEPPEAEALDVLSQAERIVDTVEAAAIAIEARRAAEKAAAAAAMQPQVGPAGAGGGP